MPYKHTQVGYAVVGMIGAMVLFTYFTNAFWIALILGVAALLFSTLTVSVNAKDISFWFGPGFLKKEFPILDIESFQVVKHHYWVWGICVLPGMRRLFSVSGFHYVELSLRTGKKYCLGTDQPGELEKALHEAMREAVHLATKVIE